MKIRVLIVAALAVGLAPSAFAQPGPAAAASKIAVVDTEIFADTKSGARRLVAAFEQINREFKPRMDELQALRLKYDGLIKTIGDLQKTTDQKGIDLKMDEAQVLQREIKRKQEDGQKALDKRTQELTGPLYADIGNALRAYAKQRGIDIVFDISKLAGTVMVTADAMDITAAFLADYNSKNPVLPAGVPAKTP
jgi:Skp family chaperone for outer membrane proteins